MAEISPGVLQKFISVCALSAKKMNGNYKLLKFFEVEGA
jgi:hypothetical protein